MATISTNISSSPRAKSGARLALFAGFGALLILMAAICVDSLHTLAAFAADNAQIRQSFLAREQTLEQVRVSLYESGNIMRDFMLSEADDATRKDLQAELDSLHAQTASALAACMQSLPASQKGPFQKLAQEMDLYWATLDPILARSASKRPGQEDSLLRNEMFLQHSHTLTIAAEVSAVNADDFHQAEQTTAQALTQFRRRFFAVASIAFALGVILAAAAFIYSGRLEARVEEKYEESVRARRELQDLSKRLVDTEERERRSISRELHDEVGQSLSALLMDVQSLATMPDEKGILRPAIENIKRLAETAVNEVRNMALLLRPSMLDDLGLVPAVEWQAREVSKRTGMLIETVDENVPDDLPEDHKVCMYRIVQEALNNCAKHAQAKKGRVVVRQAANHLQVIVEDDGKGFDASRVRGLGLLGMNERVTQLGGMLEIKSVPGRGTRVSADLPLPSA
jgi:signal transduction histidine kinase